MLERIQGQRPLRICLVSGSPSAGRCGIHDYTQKLAEALGREGLDAEILDHRDWSAAGTLRLQGRIREHSADILHMQYPMIVGWRSLGPHLTGYLANVPQVVTLHEFSSFDRLRRASVGAFALSAKRLIMTTEFEKARFLGQFGRAAAKTVVIPIGSNVPFHPSAAGPERWVVHFGQIKPGRGIEDFLELVELATRYREPWRFRIIGAPVTWAPDYLPGIQDRMKETRLEWSIDRGDEEVGQLLRSASAAYLPYPDGVSERRGSMIAALGNGVPVVATRGPFVTPELEELVTFAANPADAYSALKSMFENPQTAAEVSARGSRYVEKFDWSKIASAHRAVYEAVAERGRSPRRVGAGAVEAKR